MDNNEIRNPKFETGNGKVKYIFQFSNFDIVSDFEIRVSDLIFTG